MHRQRVRPGKCYLFGTHNASWTAFRKRHCELALAILDRSQQRRKGLVVAVHPETFKTAAPWLTRGNGIGDVPIAQDARVPRNDIEIRAET